MRASDQGMWFTPARPSPATRKWFLPPLASYHMPSAPCQLRHLWYRCFTGKGLGTPRGLRPARRGDAPHIWPTV